jgi:SAM-dependent methyltransferase
MRLGARYLLRHGYLREAVIRLVVPLDPSRYLEFPETLRELRAEPGERVLDLASPKLVAVLLARRGVQVTSVDLHEPEIESWRKLAGGEPNLQLAVADGRELPYPDGSFDHAYSISVLEHIPDRGDEQALRELARVLRPGGRMVLTLPYAQRYWEDWRDAPVYSGEAGTGSRHFFGRWYDASRIERLASAAPELQLAATRLARLRPMAVNRSYERFFPWLVPLGPLFPFLVHEKDGPGGDMMRLTFVRR